MLEHTAEGQKSQLEQKVAGKKLGREKERISF